MSETLFALVSGYGAGVLLLITFASCLALPVPASLAMLAGGAFAASEDLALEAVVVAAFVGAVAGDQAGYALGRLAGGALAAGSPRRQALLMRAGAALSDRGGPVIFFSRWAVSPLGPWLNFAAGATRMNWRRFAVWDIAGEAVWVALYVTLGYLFSSQIVWLADIAASSVSFLAMLTVTIGLGLAVRRHLRRA